MLAAVIVSNEYASTQRGVGVTQVKLGILVIGVLALTACGFFRPPTGECGEGEGQSPWRDGSGRHTGFFFMEDPGSEDPDPDMAVWESRIWGNLPSIGAANPACNAAGLHAVACPSWD